MLTTQRASVMNLENAIRGARNPMNSWDRMDSAYNEAGAYILGPNDLGLAVRLARAGSDHRKFLRQIFVSVDITAPLYWWKEFDTYKVGTVANSTSTMHRIHTKPFSREDFSCDRMDEGGLAMLDAVIAYMESERLKFLADKENRQPWHNIIQILPTSYNQMRTVTMNYENLTNIYYARRNHKLAEWHTLCDWILTLPYACELIANRSEGYSTDPEHRCVIKAEGRTGIRREGVFHMSNEMTQVDIDQLKAELAERQARVPALRDEVKRTKEYGDLSENDEYRCAKREYNRNKSRMRYLERTIENAVVIRTDSAADEVGLFDWIDIYYPEDEENRTVRLVTSLRNDVLTDNISKDSPFGRALLGRKTGETVMVRVNEKVSYPVTIVRIRKGQDDPNLKISTY